MVQVKLYLKELTKPIDKHVSFLFFFSIGEESKRARRACDAWKMTIFPLLVRLPFTKQTTSNLG